MVREYVELMYEPMAKRAQLLSANSFERARRLAAWKAKVREAWPQVSVVSVGTETVDEVTDLGATRRITAEVALGELTAEEVSVELLVGPLPAGDDMSSWETVKMRHKGANGSGATVWEGSFVAEVAGRQGLTVRAVPAHADLGVPTEMGAMAWAKSS